MLTSHGRHLASSVPRREKRGGSGTSADEAVPRRSALFRDGTSRSGVNHESWASPRRAVAGARPGNRYWPSLAELLASGPPPRPWNPLASAVHERPSRPAYAAAAEQSTRRRRVTRARSILLAAGGAAGLVVLAYVAGGEALVAALGPITWWQFAVVCAVYGTSVIVDTLAWRFAFGRGQAPQFLRLPIAKCAGEAVNVITRLDRPRHGCCVETRPMRRACRRSWSPRLPWWSRKLC
jgi:hypothetical protein